MKVVVLIPFNQDADVQAIQSAVEEYIRTKGEAMGEDLGGKGENSFAYPYFNFFAHPKTCRCYFT